MEEQERKPERRTHRHYGFIPAGVLIGLGVGLLAGYPGPGVLIGLGLGFLASGLFPGDRGSSDSDEPRPGGMNVTLLLIGAFMVIIGIGIVYAPALLWPYAIAIFLILLGIWFLARGFYKK